jgi:hypothetical protein
MESGSPLFVLMIVAIVVGGWLVNNLIRARHGYSISDDWGRNISKEDPDGPRKIALLTGENERMAGQISRLEERISVLERIATDRGNRLSDEIERLR